MNDYWKKASFGYPIQDEVRIPGSVAEMIQSEALRQQGGHLLGADGARDRSARALLGKHGRFDALSEYEKLFRLFEEGQQKVRELGHI